MMTTLRSDRGGGGGTEDDEELPTTPSSSSGPSAVAPSSVLHQEASLSGSSSSMESSSAASSKTVEDRPERQRRLLHELDAAFQYEGRLPSKQRPVLPSSSSSKDDDDAADDDGDSSGPFRCGYVSIIGAPNMGKSTLLNALLQEDLSIATRRPQTTRHAILGVLTTLACQCCLIDTPGIIASPAYMLQEGMMEAVRGAAFADSDAVLVVTDVFSTPIPDDEIFARVRQRSAHQPVLVVINKIDLAGKANRSGSNANGDVGNVGDENAVVDRSEDDHNYEEEGRTWTVPEAVAKWRALLPDALIVLPLSASGGGDDPGVALLRRILVGGTGGEGDGGGGDLSSSIRALGRPVPGMFRPGVRFLTEADAAAILPAGPPLYEGDVLTDRSERFFCAELIREALLETLHKEIPYCCEVRVTDFREPRAPGEPCNIQATIFVERDSQKPIVVGRGGGQIKQVGMLARKKIERFLGYDKYDGVNDDDDDDERKKSSSSSNESKVFLQLTVKVNKDWRKNEDRLVEFGYMKQKK